MSVSQYAQALRGIGTGPRDEFPVHTDCVISFTIDDRNAEFFYALRTVAKALAWQIANKGCLFVDRVGKYRHFVPCI